ncbi:MAG: helix-turn-helix transcriptional regulator [Clostridia bacterium]|nr:helix-turn-helix transcriptional regulator [Clostridia bacterium]
MLCDKIKELRKSHGKSQVEIANELSVTKQTVSNWENNNIQPSVDMLVKIADYFGVSTDYLLERNEKNTLSVEGLSLTEIAHIEQIIKDLAQK